MGRISSNIGLITGLPITDTVDQLMGIAARPRDLLTGRTQDLQSQQIAVTGLSARLQTLKFDLTKLSVSDPYQAREVSSQDESAIIATLVSGGQPPVSEVQVRPVQTASSQQLVSQRFSSLDDIEFSGTLSFGFGGFVDKGISLDDLNSGAGVARGQIRITDLNGSSAVIDLNFARTVDDVLNAINADTTINVTAEVDGDALVLKDNVGGTSTLTVQEVAGGTTAADLGLDDINTTSSEATGTDRFTLHAGTNLTQLNDGNGVRITDSTTSIDDLVITLADGTSAGVDLSGSATLGAVITAIQDDTDFSGKVTAAISADGNRLELTDLTNGGGTFAVSNGVLGTTADDLGLTEAANGSVVTGRRLVSGLRDTLLSSLQGGKGVGTLGVIKIIDRDGDQRTVDLASAETLNDIVDLINTSSGSVDVSASINKVRNGISLVDSSGGSGSLTVESSDATNSAEALNLVIAAQVNTVNSGTLNRQTLSESTLLSSLGGGAGITASDISITDTNGKTVPIDLNAATAEAKTLGDVIDAINAAVTNTGLGVHARINDHGDGILIVDTVDGDGILGVKDLGGTLAQDLNLTSASTTVTINDQATKVIDGTSSYSVDLSDLSGGANSISLSSLNDGAGIDFNDFKITDSTGKSLVLDLNGTDSGISTVDQLIDKINERAATLNVKVSARVNSAGTGIQITDTAGGSEKLTIENVGNSSAATDLKIEGVATASTIDGSGLFSTQSASLSVLDTVATRINDLDSGVIASTFFDGIGYRLTLSVNQTGVANEILVDSGTSDFKFSETAKARDALLVLGENKVAGSGVLVSSTANDFESIINGVDLTIVAASDDPVTVTVKSTDTDIVSTVEGFIASYNSIRNELQTLTDFNSDDFTTGLLFGTNEALRVDTTLSRLATNRYFGVGSFTSLEQIGVSVDDEGELVLDKTKLKEAFADNPTSLQTFFTDETNGVAAKFNAAIDRLSGAENGLLTNRVDALQSSIDSNSLRIERFTEQLDLQRERLLLHFFQLESVIASLQQSQTALSALQPIAPLGSA
ncbi:MAG: flagellar filament capping protein FliD [Pirellulales bacterium]